jgi:pimeloyl-ACP methyl ester carboxylesterase
MLLIMGAGASMLRWEDELCERLSLGPRYVIRFDNRDVGRSTTGPPGEVAYTYEDLAGDAFGLLDALEVPRAHIVGASMGGSIAQLMALQDPGRLLTITAIMSSPAPSDISRAIAGSADPDCLPGPTTEVLQALGAVGEVDWSDRDAIVAQQVAVRRVLAGSRHPFDAAGCAEMARREIDRAISFPSSFNHAIPPSTTPPWRHRLGEVHIPTLVIHGSEDPICPLPHGVALAAEIPDAKLLTLDGVGHEIPHAEWEVVVGAILTHSDVQA